MGLMDDRLIVMVCRYMPIIERIERLHITRTYWTPTRLMSRCNLLLHTVRGLMYYAVVENCFKGFSGVKMPQKVGQMSRENAIKSLHTAL